MDRYLDAPFDFIVDQKEVFKALLDSKESGTAIGIKSQVLGKGVFVTGVDEILIGDGRENTKIILRGYDFTGHVLETDTIRLSDIDDVCRFNSKFGNPILKTLNKILKL